MSKFNEQTVISKNLIAQEKSEDGSVLWQITAKGTLQVSVAAIENLERQFYHYGNDDSSWDDDDDSTQKRPMTWEEKAATYRGFVSAPWRAYNSQIRNIELPEGLCSIAPYAFFGLSHLETIRIPANVETIGISAFEYTAIRSISFSADAPQLREIGTKAFSECIFLETAEFPANLKYIASHAFYECRQLKNVQFPARLKCIGDNAFYGCYQLKTLLFPEGLETIEGNAFCNCFQLKNVQLPTELKELGCYAFVLICFRLLLQSVIRL